MSQDVEKAQLIIMKDTSGLEVDSVPDDTVQCCICLTNVADSRPSCCYHQICEDCQTNTSTRSNRCPQCREIFRDIITYDKEKIRKKINKYGKNNVFRQSVLQDANSQPPTPLKVVTCTFEVCQICRNDEDDHLQLVCDVPGCLSFYHTYCLGLPGVPRNDWYCPSCVVQYGEPPGDVEYLTEEQVIRDMALLSDDDEILQSTQNIQNTPNNNRTTQQIRQHNTPITTNIRRTTQRRNTNNRSRYHASLQESDDNSSDEQDILITRSTNRNPIWTLNNNSNETGRTRSNNHQSTTHTRQQHNNTTSTQHQPSIRQHQQSSTRQQNQTSSRQQQRPQNRSISTRQHDQHINNSNSNITNNNSTHYLRNHTNTRSNSSYNNEQNIDNNNNNNTRVQRGQNGRNTQRTRRTSTRRQSNLINTRDAIPQQQSRGRRNSILRSSLLDDSSDSFSVDNTISTTSSTTSSSDINTSHTSSSSSSFFTDSSNDSIPPTRRQIKRRNLYSHKNTTRRNSTQRRGSNSRTQLQQRPQYSRRSLNEIGINTMDVIYNSNDIIDANNSTVNSNNSTVNSNNSTVNTNNSIVNTNNNTTKEIIDMQESNDDIIEATLMSPSYNNKKTKNTQLPKLKDSCYTIPCLTNGNAINSHMIPALRNLSVIDTDDDTITSLNKENNKKTMSINSRKYLGNNDSESEYDIVYNRQYDILTPTCYQEKNISTTESQNVLHTNNNNDSSTIKQRLKYDCVNTKIQ